MQSIIKGILFPVLLGLFAVASAQLPPKVIADKYLVQAEQLLEKQDYEAALNMVEKSIALQKEHNLTLSDNLYFKDAVAQLLEKKDYITALNIMDRFIALQKEHSLILPDEFHFQYTQVTFFKYEQLPVPADSIRVALELVSKYLSAETEGESYKEALVLLLKIEGKLKELETSPDRTCAGKPVGSSCWLALANQPECYVWNSYLQKDQTMTWTGACSDGLAKGEGTVKGTVKDHRRTVNENLQWKYYTIIFEATGHLQNGRKQGRWVVEREQQAKDGNYQPDPSGWLVSEGPYLLGEKYGQWVSLIPWGDGENVWKKTYANGVLHGSYIYRWWNGEVVEGSYVNGEEQ